MKWDQCPYLTSFYIIINQMRNKNRCGNLSRAQYKGNFS
jgi:hypothetical protein